MGLSDYFTCLSQKTYMWVKKQKLELGMEQLNSSKLGKECNKALYYYPVYLTYMESTSCKMPCWNLTQAGIKISGRNINILR